VITPALRRAVRLPLMVGLLFGGLFTVLALFPFGRERFRRAAIRHWSRMLVRVCGVRPATVPADGARPLSALPQGSLVVANHISWLDIFVIHAQCPCSFVAKAEIASWPLLGTLVARTGTLFIERGRRHAVHRMIELIGMRLQAGGRVAVFPEGTTSDGRQLLPFHANLIEAAVRSGAPVFPVGLRYVDGGGERAGAIEYVGDTTFVASLWRITGARSVRCEVHALAPIQPGQGATRHAIAQQAREALARTLRLPMGDELPENLKRLRAGAG
jgi:1-acyl-sn-glycerol-3-phosphate acyltransferase